MQRSALSLIHRLVDTALSQHLSINHGSLTKLQALLLESTGHIQFAASFISQSPSVESRRSLFGAAIEDDSVRVRLKIGYAKDLRGRRGSKGEVGNGAVVAVDRDDNRSAVRRHDRLLRLEEVDLDLLPKRTQHLRESVASARSVSAACGRRFAVPPRPRGTSASPSEVAGFNPNRSKLPIFLQTAATPLPVASATTTTQQLTEVRPKFLLPQRDAQEVSSLLGPWAAPVATPYAVTSTTAYVPKLTEKVLEDYQQLSPRSLRNWDDDTVGKQADDNSPPSHLTPLQLSAFTKRSSRATPSSQAMTSTIKADRISPRQQHNLRASIDNAASASGFARQPSNSSWRLHEVLDRLERAGDAGNGLPCPWYLLQTLEQWRKDRQYMVGVCLIAELL